MRTFCLLARLGGERAVCLTNTLPWTKPSLRWQCLDGEYVLPLGQFSLIYTPSDWRQRREREYGGVSSAAPSRTAGDPAESP